MKRPVMVFTDFGVDGPYVGQMKAALWMHGGASIPVIDLMNDVPAFDAEAGSHLLAALLSHTPPACVVLAVVDPGVGSDRRALVVEVDGRWLVGPDNGLFEMAIRRAAGSVRAWAIEWRPPVLSTTFHGRDLFAPVAAALASGDSPVALGCAAIAVPRHAEWPDDLARVLYIDHYGNAVTGIRGATLAEDAQVKVGGRALSGRTTFADVPMGEAFWYVNSVGLIEVAVNMGRADAVLSIAPPAPILW